MSTDETFEYIRKRREELVKATVRKFCGSEYLEASLSRIVMPENDLAKVQDWLKKRKGFLVYHGNPGCGKTFFCAALANYCWAKFESARFMNESHFFSHLHRSISEDKDYIYEIHRIADCDFFIFDDLGSCGLTDWKKEAIFEFMDYRYSNGLPTVITSNLSEKEVSNDYHPRVASRIFDRKNYIISMQGIDWRKNDYCKKSEEVKKSET